MPDGKTQAVEVTRTQAQMALMALLFTALTALSAVIKIPLSPVPVTLQVFVVLLSGLILGPVWGPASQAAYLAMGLLGAPVFAAPPYAGPVVLFGPTGGYLMGFVLAAGVTGWLSGALGRKSRAGRLGSFIACLGGIAVIYSLGTCWLAAWLSLHGRGSYLAFKLGVRPFILVDLIKGLVAALLYGSTWVKRILRLGT